MTTYSVQGDEFMAHDPSMENYVNRNKREAATIYLNRLIDLGVVIMHDDMITTGPNLEHYITELDLGRWGHYNVHNARNNVEHYLGSSKFLFLQTGTPGRYRCNLQYPIYGTVSEKT
jgi:hypothetical protein